MDLYGQGEPNKKSAKIVHDALDEHMQESGSDDAVAVRENNHRKRGRE